jgi:hypothetical protein
MIGVKMPKTAILLKKPSRLYEDKFVFTYEYGWSESAGAGNSKEHKSPQVTGADLRIPVRCSWSDITVRFSVDGQAEVTG